MACPFWETESVRATGPDSPADSRQRMLNDEGSTVGGVPAHRSYEQLTNIVLLILPVFPVEEMTS